MRPFTVEAPYEPKGDQPQAIDGLARGLDRGDPRQTLLGVTGSGKTYTIAKVIERVQRPALVLSHNKTLAAQLYREFKDFFPNNAVEYFISYYDYYQPEAYVPSRDLYIEKEIDINQEIERMRLAATMSLMERRDVIVVASVSCIYGLGNPKDFKTMRVPLKVGREYSIEQLMLQLVTLQYQRQRELLESGQFRRRGDVLDLYPAYMEGYYRLEFEWDTLISIKRYEALSHRCEETLEELTVYPATHFATTPERLQKAIELSRTELAERVDEFRRDGKIIEAQRLKTRIEYDLEMLSEMGVCKGIENYSRHLTGRAAGEPPDVLLDYFPEDFLTVIDESHITLGQVRAMYNGDRARKQNLVDFGFRLPSALDNRPLQYDEFQRRCDQVIYVSATPGEEERERSHQIVEQIIRPTGLLDPKIDIRPTEGQIEDLYREIIPRTKRRERCLITTLTKKMAEHFSEYLRKLGLKTEWLHSELDAIERVEIIQKLRRGGIDVLVGVNLLREGLDLPEVSLVAVMDADKVGFLRSATSLIQTIGRAARNAEGTVIMYADRMSSAMETAVEETRCRREKQEAYNLEHNITPRTIQKEVKNILERRLQQTEQTHKTDMEVLRHQLDPLDSAQRGRLIQTLEKEMRERAKDLDFEKAALLRDEVQKLRSENPDPG